MRDWGDLSRFPTDPTPAEVAENVRQLAEMVVANCRALPSLTTPEALHSVHDANAVAGRLIYERSGMLRAGNGQVELERWAGARQGGARQ